VDKTKIIEGFVIAFGLYIAYQIIKKILGGSWGTEDIIIGLLIFNSGAIFTMAIMLSHVRSDLNHLKGQFRSLVSDFKTLKEQFHSLASDLKKLKEQFHSLASDLKKVKDQVLSKTF